MDLWPPNDYLKAATERGVPPGVASEALGQARAQQQAGRPPILTLNHLVFHVDVPYEYLRQIVAREFDPYRLFWVRKRSGGRRLICVPDPPLLKLQRWVNRHVLLTAAAHPASFAYGRDCSALACAREHVGCRWLIKVDVRQFFESISEIQVYRAFRILGYGSLVSFELSRLTTRVFSRSRRYRRANWRADRSRYSIADYSRGYRLGYLPQGAPTSPILSNLAVKAVDDSLTLLARAHHLVYTRYADDLAFSTAAPDFSRSKAIGVVHAAYAILARIGLRPRTAKTVIAPPGARKIVLGLLVDGKVPRLSRSFRARLYNHLRCIHKFGPVKHAESRGFRSVLGLRRHLEGLVSFAASVDRPLADDVRKQLSMLDWPL